MAEPLSCIFYKYTGDPRVANKALGNAVHTCPLIKPLEPLSDLDIRLIIDYPDEEGTPKVMSANYVAIDNKYYQITNKERLPGHALAIYATIDGLKTYWDEISACNGIVQRTGTTNSYIYDPYYQTYLRSYVSYAPFSGKFSDDYQIVLSYVK